MKLPSHGPEPCASANSAISASFLFSLTRLFHYTSFCDFCKLFLKFFLIFFDLFFCFFRDPFILQGFGWVYLMIQNYPFIPDFTAAFLGLKPPGSNPRFLIRTRILSEVISSLNIIRLVKFILHQCQVDDLKP